MGLIEKFKSGLEHAQEAARQGATMTVPDAGQTDYSQLASKLAQSGISCIAVIESIEETGKEDPGGKQFAMRVRVERNGSPYDTTVEQFLVESAAPDYAAGTRWNAQADPDDRCRLLLYSRAS